MGDAWAVRPPTLFLTSGQGFSNNVTAIHRKPRRWGCLHRQAVQFRGGIGMIAGFELQCAWGFGGPLPQENHAPARRFHKHYDGSVRRWAARRRSHEGTH
jgi:hypothetical protein